MKLIRRLGLTVLLLAFGAVAAAPQDPCSQGTPYRECKACGTAKTAKAQELNINKNREEKATAPEQITVQQIRDPKNNKKFSPDRRVWVTGYVASAGLFRIRHELLREAIEGETLLGERRRLHE